MHTLRGGGRFGSGDACDGHRWAKTGPRDAWAKGRTWIALSAEGTRTLGVASMCALLPATPVSADRLDFFFVVPQPSTVCASLSVAARQRGRQAKRVEQGSAVRHEVISR